jgi:hypothetical protein
MKKFTDPRLGVYCCGHVYESSRDVLLVSREGGDWQFVCGKGDHHDPEEPYHVSVGVLLDRDPTLHDLSDLPPGWEAERNSRTEPWLRTTSKPDT